MSISVGTICGLSLGLEYVAVDPELEIYESCILLDLFIFRFIFSFDEK